MRDFPRHVLVGDNDLTTLNGLQNASVVNDPGQRQIVSNGGPADIQQLVKGLIVPKVMALVTDPQNDDP